LVFFVFLLPPCLGLRAGPGRCHMHFLAPRVHTYVRYMHSLPCRPYYLPTPSVECGAARRLPRCASPKLPRMKCKSSIILPPQSLGHQAVGGCPGHGGVSWTEPAAAGTGC
jgi:hypothetical protein